MTTDDVLKVVMKRLGGGMPLVDIQTELTGVLLDISGRADFLTAVQTIETVAGQTAYDLPENSKSVHEVFIETVGILENKTYRDYLIHIVTGRVKYRQYGRVQNQPVNFPFSYVVLS